MNGTALVRTGVIGAVIGAVCCATPVLVIALGAVGLGALAGYLDYVLLPIFVLCLGLIGYGMYRRRQSAIDCCAYDISKTTRTEH